VPLALPAVEALRRLRRRGEFLESDDYVFVNVWGERIDSSALRRRYKGGCEAAGLRPLELHGLRHAAGSIVARTADPVFVRDMLGHASSRRLIATSPPSTGRRSSHASTPRSRGLRRSDDPR
jgi:integrase